VSDCGKKDAIEKKRVKKKTWSLFVSDSASLRLSYLSLCACAYAGIYYCLRFAIFAIRSRVTFINSYFLGQWGKIFPTGKDWSPNKCRRENPVLKICRCKFTFQRISSCHTFSYSVSLPFVLAIILVKTSFVWLLKNDDASIEILSLTLWRRGREGKEDFLVIFIFNFSL